jgi:two-component system response regulator
MLKNQNKFSFIIADDDIDDQSLIQEAIKSIDNTIEYTAVFNGSQLLDLLLKKGAYRANDQCEPDAIILDLNMPVMDGLGALKQIKDNPLLKEIPIFILYTLRKDDYSVQCRSIGAAGIYVKPGTSEELRSIINEIYLICEGKLKSNKMRTRHGST